MPRRPRWFIRSPLRPCLVEELRCLLLNIRMSPISRPPSRRLVSQEMARRAFRLCLARPPGESELHRLTALYQKELAGFKTNTNAAERMACSELGKAPAGADVAELAAWTVVANVLLNLDEILTKG